MSELRGKSGLIINLDAQDGPKCIAAVTGDLGVRECDDFEQLMTPICEQRELVVIDLSKVGFISSLGMGVLVAIQRGIRMRGGRIRLAAVTPQVEESFRRVGLDKVFKFSASAEEALKAT